MTISIRDPETDRMARELARQTGKPITTVVKEALAAYGNGAQGLRAERRLAALREVLKDIDALPVLDNRSAKEIMDELYDEDGLPA